MTDRMGYWVDTERPLPDDDPRLRRVGVVGAQADLREGSAGRGLPGRAVLPALRHRALRPRARPGLRDRHRPLGLRPVPADVRPVRRARRACSSGRRPRGRWCPTPPSRCTPRSTTSWPTDGDGDAGRGRAAVRRRSSGTAGPSRRRCPGRDMERWGYQRPFELVEFPATPARRTSSCSRTYVTTEDGTGLVHQSPAFGEDDMAVCQAYGLPVVNPVRPDGHFDDDVALVGGQFFKHADTDLVRGPRRPRPAVPARGLRALLPALLALPHRAALLRPAVLVRPHHRASRTRCSARTRRPTGSPTRSSGAATATGCNNNIDWALSRSRYWGTPLPIWRCAEDHLICVGSLAELSELTGTDQSDLDPHRPYVDDVVFACPSCGGEARRVPEVIDAWFDSGSMPFAQWGYPHAPGSEGAVRARPTRPTSSARRSTRPAAGSTR